MNSRDVGYAYDMLLEELEQVIPALNAQMSELTSQKKFDQAQGVLDKAKQVSAMQQKVKTLREEWQKLDLFGPEGEPIEGRTPTEVFRFPLLRALVEFGGRAHCRKVIARIEEDMGHQLSDVDRQTLKDTKTIRWENSVHWMRQIMVEEGLLLPMERRGYWEISPEGRRFLDKSK
jgi:DNA repair exonuclease SbcCD ATPase subunit